jgi:hypothetical protein
MALFLPGFVLQAIYPGGSAGGRFQADLKVRLYEE